MSWEAWSATGSMISAVVIAISAAFAIRQVKELERSTQFDSTDRMLKEFYSSELKLPRRYVLTELPERLQDPVYRKQLAAVARVDARAIDTDVHPEIAMLDYFERLGSYVYTKLLVSPAIFELISVYLVHSWPFLSDVIEIVRREQDNPYMYDKSELLYDQALRQSKLHFRKRPKLRPSSGKIFDFQNSVRP